MPLIQPTDADLGFLKIAFEEARAGYEEGGVPVGAAMVAGGQVIARGRNGLVQEGNPILHGETACLRRAGRGVDYARVTLYTSLSPCAMCSGAIVLFGIPRVIIGEAQNFPGEIDWLLSHGKEIAVVDDPEMVAFFRTFMDERPDLWGEDITGYARG